MLAGHVSDEAFDRSVRPWLDETIAIYPELAGKDGGDGACRHAENVSEQRRSNTVVTNSFNVARAFSKARRRNSRSSS